MGTALKRPKKKKKKRKRKKKTFISLYYFNCKISLLLGLTRFHGRFGPGPEGLRGRPAVLGDAGLAPKARGVDPLSRVTRAQERGPAVFSIPPGRMALVSVGTR